jgi:nucleotide-binding universal stress UspA family protein
MRRILVPLDGSQLGESILADACELSGHNGELVLLHVVPSLTTNRGTGRFSGLDALKGSEAYLESVAEPLRAHGFFVKKRTEVRANLSAAIDEAAIACDVEMVAVATHGRGPGGRMLHGGVAWKALANSTVPVFLRHVEDHSGRSEWPQKFRVMVPLDGSEYSEKALPIAQRLSLKWNAELWLVRVVERLPQATAAVPGLLEEQVKEVEEAEGYLASVSSALERDVLTATKIGSVVSRLVDFSLRQGISHVVMASHGRTALSRVILGSVADNLIHELTCGIVVIPALASGRLEEHPRHLLGTAIAGTQVKSLA